MLPPGVALGIIAFLLSLLPAGFFIWLLYLRRQDRSVKASMVTTAFALGLLLVVPAFALEDWSEQLWRYLSPETAHYFAGAILPLQGLSNILWPAIGTFLVVATVEEGLRYIVLRVWIQKSKRIDQVFDGALLGLAIGLGFATLENTIYFLNLFQSGSYDTLVFVFFLRFLISTLAHVSFSGLMGALVARGVFDVYRGARYFWPAFLIPWFVHGLYDLLLGINFSLYAVLVLVPGLVVFIMWTQRREFTIIHRQDGQILASALPSGSTEGAGVDGQSSESPNASRNKEAPWLRYSRYVRKRRDTIDGNES